MACAHPAEYLFFLLLAEQVRIKLLPKGRMFLLEPFYNRPHQRLSQQLRPVLNAVPRTINVQGMHFPCVKHYGHPAGALQLVVLMSRMLQYWSFE